MNVSFLGSPASGKALAIDTLIPTLKGFKKMEHIEVGDKIYDNNGKLCNVNFITEIMYNKECYKIFFKNGESIVTDKDHLWNIVTKSMIRRKSEYTRPKGRNEQPYRLLKTTKEIFDSKYRETKDSNRCKYALKIPNFVFKKYKKLCIEPYLLGIWLGDGFSDGGRIACNDIEIIDKIRSLNYKINKNKAKFIYGIYGLETNLKKMNLIRNKHIPDIYINSSIEQRFELVRGLMDSDGTVSSNGNCTFDNKNFNIIESLKTILASLGIPSSISSKMSKLYGKNCGVCYRLSFTVSSNKKYIFSLTRKKKRLKDKTKQTEYRHIFIDRIEKCESVPVKCIQVDSKDHLYLCTKSFLPTHNTTIAAMLFAKFKTMGIVSEFITEQARLYIAEKKLETKEVVILTDEDQINIMTRQLRVDLIMASSLDNKSGIVITDTSPLNALLYMSNNYLENDQVMNMIEKTINNTDILFYCAMVKNNFAYSDPNRIHTLEQAIETDRKIPDMIKKCILQYVSKIVYLNGDLQEKYNKALFTINEKMFKNNKEP